MSKDTAQVVTDTAQAVMIMDTAQVVMIMDTAQAVMDTAQVVTQQLQSLLSSFKAVVVVVTVVAAMVEAATVEAQEDTTTPQLNHPVDGRQAVQVHLDGHPAVAHGNQLLSNAIFQNEIHQKSPFKIWHQNVF